MRNQEFDLRNYIHGYSKSIKDYILLIRTNLKRFIIISSIIFIAALAYALLAPSIYESTVTLKISTSQKNLLQNGAQPEASDRSNDRFIANEMEVIENFGTRELVAKALVDSIENSKDKSIYKLLNSKMNEARIKGRNTIIYIAEFLKKEVKKDQKLGMDIVDISAESPSPKEAAIIANTYAIQYKKLNLKESRNQLTVVREFLEKQSHEKLAELNTAENALANFKEKGGIVALDAQSQALISQLSQLDAQRDAAKIDLMTSNAVLSQYKKQINNLDPQLVNYLASQTSQAYIDVLQKQIAELQMNRDLAMANKSASMDVSGKVKDYDRKINDLKDKLSSKINEIKTGAFASSPEQAKDLTQKLIEEEVKNHSLSIKLNELQTIISQYDVNLNKLPKKSMEFAELDRNAEATKQLYALLEQKYQEAVINELSQPGNVFIIGEGRVPDKPAKPLRVVIALIGLITGFGAAFGYVLIKDYFDDTIKTPEDIQKKDIKLLSWIPKLKAEKNNGHHKTEVIVLEEPNSPASEAFKVLRARAQVASIKNKPVKTILISSAWQGEGKTMVAVNLAYSLAMLKKKTLLIDCDLRRPRIHRIMDVTKTPGLVDYMMNKVALRDILRRSKLEYMRYITSGTIRTGSSELFDTLKETAEKSRDEYIRFTNSGTPVADPTELFASDNMVNFLKEMKTHFDYIIIDSAPLVTVIDSEILAKYADGIMLVVSADTTQNKLMNETLDLIKEIDAPFLGIVLNNFKYKHGYDYYFKYHYNYSNNGNDRKREKKRKKV